MSYKSEKALRWALLVPTGFVYNGPFWIGIRARGEGERESERMATGTGGVLCNIDLFSHSFPRRLQNAKIE